MDDPFMRSLHPQFYLPTHPTRLDRKNGSDHIFVITGGWVRGRGVRGREAQAVTV